MKPLKASVFLIVDDFESMRKVSEAQLRSLGVDQVITANNGAEALRILGTQHVDVVLSDWNMPVMSGLSLLKALRADAKLYALPFLMITAEAARERVAEAIACGVSDLIVKPYTAKHLATRIEKALTWKPRKSTAINTPQHAVAIDRPVASLGNETRSRSEVRPPAILIVDDTPDNLQVLTHLFAKDYLVRVATNGERALEMCCSDDPPDLVLLDIMMPGMDGFEVARRMREHPNAETIPVIFVTAMAGDDARLRGLELGAVDFVTKPIDPNILKPRVRNFMRYVALRKQAQADYDDMLETARLREDVEQITRHDLKAPLAGVIGLVQTLIEDNTIERDELTGRLRMIEETALQVMNMINLSSELFKIETGRFKLDPKPVPVCDILHRIAGILNLAFSEKHVTVSVDASLPEKTAGAPEAMGDAMFCYSLFHNLVKNACEAAPENSEVSITLGDQTPLRIKISNQGAVPAEIRQQFFDKFVTKDKNGGTGLGTYSAKLLTEAQAGQIELDVSDEANTTEITVVLPRTSPP